MNANSTTIQEHRARLEPIALRLCSVARELGLETLADTIATDTRRRLADDIMRVLVLGEIKQGKSTLINAIIGRDALPMGVTPTTGATVIVRRADAGGHYLVTGNGDRTELSALEFAARARGPAPAGAPAGQLELWLNDDVLPIGLELVDTPGINDIAAYRAAISRGELPRADVLVLTLDATQLLNRTELAFLRDALSAVGGLGDSGARLLLVVNRIDLVGEDDRPKLREYLDRELAALTRPSGAPIDVFETDARGALRDPSGDTHGVAEIRRLRARLQALAGDRADVLPARARAGLLRHAVLLAHNAAIAAHALRLERETLQREIRTLEREWSESELDMGALRSEMASSRERLLRASKVRLGGFRDQLHTSTLAAIGVASHRVLATHLPGALHDAFLGFSHEEAQTLRTGLDELTRHAIKTHSDQVRRRLHQATLRLSFRGPTIYLDPPSVALEVGLVAIGLAGTAIMYFGNLVAGMVMTVAGPLATVFLREQSLRQARQRAAAELPGALESASVVVEESVARAVDGHIAALDEHLVLANRTIGEQLAAVLRHAEAQLVRDDAPNTDDAIGARRENALDQIAALEHELVALRQQLDTANSDHARG